MPKYLVRLRTIEAWDYVIEAENEDAALEDAADRATWDRPDSTTTDDKVELYEEEDDVPGQ